ncbi:MAG: MFS transporter [Candidatus Bathyarchaeota archaeon]|nr:MAG: MFS transporter [Candidatus Bathyarchaeota archaeon]
MESLLTPALLFPIYLGRDTILAIYFISIAFSSVGGITVLSRIPTRTFLIYWMITDIVALLFPSLFTFGTEIEFLLFTVWLGFSVGVGFPRCLTFFSNSTTMEERGRVGGAIIFVTYLLTPILLLVTRGLEYSIHLAIYAGWRAVGLATIYFIGADEFSESSEDEGKIGQQLTRSRQLLLYFIPWATFSLINGMDIHVYGKFHTQETIETGLMLMQLSGSFSSILGGVAIDFVGRRTSITFAMVILGLGYVALSFAQSSLLSWFFFSVTLGIAWGVLSIAYVLVIWGELGSREKREKYYAIGMIPFFLSQAIGYLLKPILSQFSSTQLFSTATLLYFLAVIPLLFAEDILPLRVIEQRRMKEYIRKAKQITD